MEFGVRFEDIVVDKVGYGLLRWFVDVGVVMCMWGEFSVCFMVGVDVLYLEKILWSVVFRFFY